MSFFSAYGLPLTVARPFNTYGPRQSARAVIPTIITQLASGVKKIKLGDVSPTRDFNYVADTCMGLLALANCDLAIGEVVNIGSNYEISIEGTFNLIRDLMNIDAELVHDVERLRPKNSEVHRLLCDNQKFIKLTGLSPKFSLNEGIKSTVDWFGDSENLAKYKSNIYNV